MSDNKEESIRKTLADLGVTEEEVLMNTPRRVLKFLEKYTTALREEFNDFKSFPSEQDQMVIVETKFWSLCEHHLLPFFGKVYVGYIPNGKVVGISKIIRFVQHTAMKPSIQENLTEEISKRLQEVLDPLGVIVVMKGFHTCVASRYDNGWMTTSAVSGIFKENSGARNEFLRLMRDKPDGVIY